jgi:hypothetical protein
MTVADVVAQARDGRVEDFVRWGTRRGSGCSRRRSRSAHHVPLNVLSDTIPPFPSLSGIYDAALTELRMDVAKMPHPMKPENSQMATVTK